uniref:cyclic nucleotide-gated ion channel 1-like n=1 Tax=Fragaria vesca subsp. vesca TaxID=101020 RepID=UPI0005CB7C20|nr:PREDICTED: cyclic nucleotide-gated ion channel 1-like [Fragaria vesca subsp. vesca]
MEVFFSIDTELTTRKSLPREVGLCVSGYSPPPMLARRHSISDPGSITSAERSRLATLGLARSLSLNPALIEEQSTRVVNGGHRLVEEFSVEDSYSVSNIHFMDLQSHPSDTFKMGRLDRCKERYSRTCNNLLLVIRTALIDQHRPFLPKLKLAFVVSCVLAVSLDPLFLYIPIVDRNRICIGLHKTLMRVALSFRSVTDLCYIAHIVFQTRNLMRDKVIKLREVALWTYCFLLYNVVDLLAVLPIPQVIIFVLLKSSFLNRMKLLSSLALSQYVPRVARVYISCMELIKTPNKVTERRIYFGAIFSFFLYILVGHVFGAFWYFLAIQREATCWKEACRNDNRCEPTTFYCNDHTVKNITILKEFCSINRQDAFDYGMFRDAVQHEVLESTNFSKKFFHCFWWGLRNLSSLGQNLDTSIYTWENIFAVFIAISGLLLVLLYLTSNLKLVTRTSSKMKAIRLMKLKDLEVQLWLSRNGIGKPMRTKIMRDVHRKLEPNKDVHLESILSILSSEQKNFMKRELCSFMLMNKLPRDYIQNIQVFKAIFDNLKPVSYTEGNDIFREGEPLTKTIFITQGIVLSYRTSNQVSTSIKSLGKGDICGEELLDWAATFSSFSNLPISTSNVKSLTNVEAFVLIANDLKNVISKFWIYFSQISMFSNPFSNPTDSQLENMKLVAISSVRTNLRQRRGKKF